MRADLFRFDRTNIIDYFPVFWSISAVKKVLTLSLSMLCAAVLAARADIIPSFVGVTPSGGNTVWTYSIDITSTQYVTTGNFFTIYDFGPFIGGTGNQPSGWTLTSSLVSTPPFQTNPPDDPTLLNLTWTYTGTNIPSNTTLSPFEVTIAGITPSPVPIRDSRFAAEGTNSTNDTSIGNVGHISVPVLEPTVPEASTFSLLVSASGLMGVCWIVSRLRKRQLRA
jgi:hypothetical protein